MSFLYPRVIAITRAVPQAIGVGVQPYNYETPASESAVVSGVPASIQFDTRSKAPSADVPGDTIGRTLWNILIPPGALALGVIQVRDIVTDDQGQRYQVTAPTFTSLGYQLRTERLEN